MSELAKIEAPDLPEGVLAVRVGTGANCSSVGSALDVLFYAGALAAMIAVAIAAAMPAKRDDDPRDDQR